MPVYPGALTSLFPTQNSFRAGVARRGAKLSEQLFIKPGGSHAKRSEPGSKGLEDLFERPQISLQTRMPNLIERKSTRRVENAAAQPSSVREQVRQWAINRSSRNFTANCVCWGHTCAFEGSTWTGKRGCEERCGA